MPRPIIYLAGNTTVPDESWNRIQDWFKSRGYTVFSYIDDSDVTYKEWHKRIWSSDLFILVLGDQLTGTSDNTSTMRTEYLSARRELNKYCSVYISRNNPVKSKLAELLNEQESIAWFYSLDNLFQQLAVDIVRFEDMHSTESDHVITRVNTSTKIEPVSSEYCITDHNEMTLAGSPSFELVPIDYKTNIPFGEITYLTIPLESIEFFYCWKDIMARKSRGYILLRELTRVVAYGRPFKKVELYNRKNQLCLLLERHEISKAEEDSLSFFFNYLQNEAHIPVDCDFSIV